MARQIRIQFRGAWYHVNHRGAARQPIFLSDHDRSRFLDTLGETYERYNLEIHAYCLMTNHYHLIVRTPDGNLAQAMRHLNSSYTQRFNRRHDVDGPLFRGRYNAKVVQDDDYLLTAVRYVHQNPLEAGLESALGGYRWSSLRAYVGIANRPSWLQVGMMLGRFEDSAQRFLDFTAQNDAGRPIARAVVHGSEGFGDHLLSGTSPDSETQPSYRKANVAAELASIDTAVGQVFGCAEESLFRGARGQLNAGRLAAILLAAHLTGLTQAELAAHYRYSNYRGIASALRRASGMWQELPSFRNQLELVIDRLGTQSQPPQSFISFKTKVGSKRDLTPIVDMAVSET